MAPMTAQTIPSSSSTLVGLVRRRAPREEIASYLDGLGYGARLEQVQSVTGSLVGRLYDAGTVIFEGRNSLPAFTRFQKRFMRAGETVLGYNHQLMAFATGPGYFVVRPPTPGEAHPDELFFDYTSEPPVHPPTWPEFRPNTAGLSRAVYMNMKDFCRHVAKGVLVGKAYKLGVAQNAYFTLTKPY